MAPVFWLALLFGYLVGAGGAVLFLPPELIEPLYGALAAITVVVVVITAVVVVRDHRRRRHRPRDSATSPPTEPDPPAGGRSLTSRSLAPSPRQPGRRPTGAPTRTRSANSWPVPTAVAPAATLGVDELRQALFEGRVRIAMQPLTALPARAGCFYHAAARLCDVHGRPFPARRYRPTLIRCGLLGVFDRLVVVHARQALARAAAHPDASDVDTAGLRLVCGIDASSLREPSLIAELEQMAVEDRWLLPQIVLQLERRRLDRATRQRVERLRQLGMRFCLHRLTPDCRAAIGRGFDFIKIEMAPARLEEADAERDLAIATLTAAGLTVLVDRGEPAGLVEIGKLPWSLEAARQSAA